VKKIGFAQNLRRFLDERALSITKVSAATGIPVSTLSEWTAGREPKVSDSLLKLSAYLEVTLDQLVFAEEPKDGIRQKTESSVFVELEGRRYELRFNRMLDEV